MPIMIKVNGRDRSLEEGLKMSDLLKLLEVEPGGVIIERNRQVVDSEYVDHVRLEEGDEVEILRIVGGG